MIDTQDGEQTFAKERRLEGGKNGEGLASETTSLISYLQYSSNYTIPTRLFCTFLMLSNCS